MEDRRLLSLTLVFRLHALVCFLDVEQVVLAAGPLLLETRSHLRPIHEELGSPEQESDQSPASV